MPSLYFKSCTLEPGGLFTTKDFEEGVQTLDTAITEMSACSLKEEIKNEFPVNDKAEEKRVENNFLFSNMSSLGIVR